MGFVSVTLGITQTLNMAIKKSKITWKQNGLLSHYYHIICSYEQ